MRRSLSQNCNVATDSADVALQCGGDAAFSEWLANSQGSLVVSTYQAGKLLVIGWNGRQLSLLPRRFEKPMGIDVAGEQMVVATRNGVTRLSNDELLAHHFDHAHPGRYDALYVPRLTHHMADINVHDVALAGDQVWIVNTRFSCLAVLDAHHSFVPRWQPSFVSQLVPEDRCHLNGLAMVDGQPGYVTALGETDSVGGWRHRKVDGGVVIDVRSQEVVLRGLAMPHSPRWHAGALYVLNSGCGQLLKVDPRAGRAEVVCELPAYLRGLCFVGPHALVGLCKIREAKVFSGMPVQERHAELQCGLAIVDLRNGRTVGSFQITEGCTEIYDLRFLPGKRRVNVLNTLREEARQVVTAPGIHYWLRPENEIKD